MRSLLHIALAVAGIFAPVAEAEASPGAYAECGGVLSLAESRQAIDFAELAKRAAAARFVVFGERHGVRGQSVASSCVLSAMAQGGRPVALVMEILSRDDNEAIHEYRSLHPESAAGLGVELKWWTRGWPAFENWLPLIDRAFGLRATILGGDLSQRDNKPRTLTKSEAARIAKQLGRFERETRAKWREAIVEAHCGMLSDREALLYADLQIRRDLSIAESAGETDADGAALIQVGRAHGRKDRSLYATLSRDRSEVITIGAFAEGEAIGEADRQAYDYIWVTGKAVLADPCAFAREEKGRSQ